MAILANSEIAYPGSRTDSEKAAADALVQLAADHMATAEEVSKEATERSASVLSNWKVLEDILDRHEEALRKRWIRKMKTWKKTILSKTWPNMPAFHRPDMEILYDEELGAESVEKRPMEPFLLPYATWRI